MTIVVGVAAPDGLILAADSRTTFTDGERTRVASDSAEKIFRLCKGRFGVACYGTALFQYKTVAGHIDEFEAGLDSPPEDVGVLADQLGRWFQDSVLDAYRVDGQEWEPDFGAQLGFLMAGYDHEGVGKLIDVKVPGPDGPRIETTDVSTTNIGVLFEGQTDVIRRLLGGVDSDALVESGVEVSSDVSNALGDLEYKLLMPLTLQDAIDCATFLIRTTIGMQRFSDGTAGKPGGVPGCGGAIRVLAVSRKDSLWVARPDLALPA